MTETIHDNPARYYGTLMAIRRTLREMVGNLDSQREQLEENALKADNDTFARLAKQDLRPIDLGVTTDHHRRQLTETFREIEQARAHLVLAHGELGALIPRHITQQER
jgi:hypothetical protein